ncbi:MAG: glycoside hydrolase family 88 protein, partial [Candidatus Omnitrophota bacterium]
MGFTNTKTSPIRLAAEWILNSGIQSDAGGFYSWYDMEKKDYPYLYSEITGYGITTLLFLYRMVKDNRYLDNAKRAADWIINTALHICGGVMTRLYKDDKNGDPFYSFTGENIFSFDTGMVLYGMVNLYKVTKDIKYLNVSKVLAGFLVDKIQKEDGSLSPAYNARDNRIIELSDKWSLQPGAFHAKVTMGLADISEVTGDEKYRDAAIALCRYALNKQKPDGRFITDKVSGSTNLHPHCYAAEGLLYTGTCFKIEEFIDSAKKAATWIFDRVSEDGINELYNPHTNAFTNFQRSDVLAQALRLGVLFSLKDKIDMLKSKLLEYQYMGEDNNQHGGFLYAKNTSCVNSWCTMFAIQALVLHDNISLA